MSFQNIPQELRDCPQWILWKLEENDTPKPTKVPYCGKTGNKASVTNPKTWCTFNEARTYLGDYSIYSGIGFVFTNSDEYCGIDLDDSEGDPVIYERQLKVFTEFNSYTEFSPSGKGLHLICKGKLKHGRRRSKIEIYSSERFFTMTGDVYKDAPIEDRQELLNILWEQMGTGSKVQSYDKEYNGPQTEDDNEIIRKASTAFNGNKFNSLHSGNWQTEYSSQSEADLAYINIIAFYTQNREQITRIFRSSPLGIRDKAWRDDYVTYNINKSFDNILPPIDLDDLKNNLNEAWANIQQKGDTLKSASPEGAKMLKPGAQAMPSSPGHDPNGPASEVTLSTSKERVATMAEDNSPVKSIYPPGLLGEIAEFIEAQAPRPVPEIALVAAIGLMSGICGKAYNVSGTGLNSYTMILAATGCGKEAAASGIGKLVDATLATVPSIVDFIGPGEIASPQALHKHLKNNACFMTLSGEVGLLLQELASPRAPSNMIGLKRLLLNLYNKSGETDVLQGSIYSDKSNNIDAVKAPSFSWVGESTPERFYGALDENLIADGLIPRFNVIEYSGERTNMNYSAKEAKPSFQLIDKLGTVVAKSQELMSTKKAIHIKIDDAADNLLRNFDKFCDEQIREQREVIRQLWNRAHLKALKLAGLIAVGISPYDPIITHTISYWAVDRIVKDTRNLASKFESGEIGGQQGDVKQMADMRKAINKYLTQDSSQINSEMRSAAIVPYLFIFSRCVNLISFKSHKNGSAFAIKSTLNMMIDSGYLQECGSDLKNKFGVATAKVYSIKRPAYFLE